MDGKRFSPRMKRRRFLQTTALAAATLPSPAFALGKSDAYRKNIGIQLYTLRNQLAKDTPGTLKQVAAAGYKQVELYGFPDCDAMIKGAKDAGLAIHSSHFAWDCVANPKDDKYSDFSKTLEKATKTGIKHLVIPYLADGNRKSLDDYRKVADHANACAAMARKAGIQLAYHNHNFEFQPKEDGKCGYDIFIERFSPEMMFEIDVFWVKAGGKDPAELIRNLKGRVSQLHLKDLKRDVNTPTYGSVPNDAFQELGDGVIAMAPVLDAALAAGVEHCHVEQDQSPDPLASIRQSIGFLGTI